MGAEVDEAFIRRAVELADLAAVRVALFQATRDPEVESLGPVAQLERRRPRDADREGGPPTSSSDAAGVTLERPAEDELRHLMEMATGIADDRPGVRGPPRPAGVRRAPVERGVARRASRELPEGFHVAIIGAGFSGIAAGAQFERLGIPYTIFERRHEVGGVWSINKYPDARVDTASSTYEYNFEKNYPWTEYFARQAEVRGYLEHVAKKHGMWAHLRFDSDLKAARCSTSERSVWHLEFGQPDGIDVRGRGQRDRQRGRRVREPEVRRLPRQRALRAARSSTRRSGRPTTTSPASRSRSSATARPACSWWRPIAREAKQVYVFQRTAQWISPRPKYGQPIEPEVRWLLDTMPGYWNWQRYTATAALFAVARADGARPRVAGQGRLRQREERRDPRRSSPTTSSRRSVTAPTSSRSSCPTTRR